MLNNRKTARFCSHLQMLLTSGLQLLPALNLISGQTKDKRLSKQILLAAERLSEGLSLSEAAAHFLPPIAQSSIRSAEKAGNLDDVLGQLSGYYENKAEIEEKIKGALVYPIFVLVLSLAIVSVIFLFVLPGMRGMFEEIGGELPLLTRLIFGAADWFGPLLLALILFGGLLYFFGIRGKRLKWKIPLLNKLVQQDSTINGFSALGSLLQSGTSLSDALEMVLASSTNEEFGGIIGEAKAAVENGSSLSAAFSRGGCFSNETIQMLEVGENSGRLAEMLLNIAEYQARERELLLKKITALLEPALTLSVGLVVGCIVLAIFLPMMSMISAIN